MMIIFGDNEFKVDNNVDEKVYLQFNFDNSDVMNDFIVIYGSILFVFVVSNVKKQGFFVVVVGYGCVNM